MRLLPIENDDGISRGQINAHAAGARGQQEDEGGGVLVEPIDGLLAIVARDATVQTLAEQWVRAGMFKDMSEGVSEECLGVFKDMSEGVLKGGLSGVGVGVGSIPRVIAELAELLDEVDHLHHLGENQHLDNAATAKAVVVGKGKKVEKVGEGR